MGAAYAAHSDSARGRLRHDLVKRRLLAELPTAPARILDVGCGNGESYLRSTNFARPDLFGSRHDRLEAKALELLERHSEGGGLVEDAVFTVLLARRPGGKA
ncbi:hypothetical protein [Streptomyces sp. NPDC001876]|uniref:hypothetical protein n=1 Tax=Streptomyces sp. NPDC001876 TaxID=3154402 RepID=UPI0033180C94